MEIFFETLINNRLVFVNEAFDEIDRHNGGFLHGTRTSENVFVLNGLLQIQMALGKSLLVCFVDFSKAFDIINRNILYHLKYEIMYDGLHIDMNMLMNSFALFTYLSMCTEIAFLPYHSPVPLIYFHFDTLNINLIENKYINLHPSCCFLSSDM